MTTRSQANTYLLSLISNDVLTSASALSWINTLSELCSIFGSDVDFTKSTLDPSRFTIIISDILLNDGSTGSVKIELIVSGTATLDDVSNLPELESLMSDTSRLQVHASSITQYKEVKNTNNIPLSATVDDFEVSDIINNLNSSKFEKWISQNKPTVSRKHSSTHGSYTRISTINFVSNNKLPLQKQVVLDIDTSFLWAFELDKSFNGVDYDAQKYPDILTVVKGLISRTPSIEGTSLVNLITWLSTTNIAKESLLVIGSDSSPFKVARLFVA